MFLHDEAMTTCLRYRLGLEPDAALPEGRCACGASLGPGSHPYHACHCPLLKRTFINNRHGGLVQQVADAARSAGAETTVGEPAPGVFFPDNRHADCGALLNGRYTHIDASVADPSAPHIAVAAQTPLKAASDREKAKIKKYRVHCELGGDKFNAFVLESYGAWGAEAVQVLDAIVGHARVMDLPEARQLRLETIWRVSIALQKGNAQVITQGCQYIWRRTQDSQDLAPSRPVRRTFDGHWS